jgi:UDP-glucose 6-dehydrogenase
VAFGGACFPKDTAAFSAFAKHFSILNESIKVNNEYRKNYELDEREKEQNVHYKPVGYWIKGTTLLNSLMAMASIDNLAPTKV